MVELSMRVSIWEKEHRKEVLRVLGMRVMAPGVGMAMSCD